MTRLSVAVLADSNSCRLEQLSSSSLGSVVCLLFYTQALPALLVLHAEPGLDRYTRLPAEMTILPG